MKKSFDGRFFSKVYITSDCWIWTGAKTTGGYGQIQQGDKVQYAHRIAYEQIVGLIPDGFEIDHLCRNRACVRPDHLEPVTARENTLRGKTLPAVNAAKTECPQGHPYDYFHLNRYGRPARGCTICRRENQRRRARSTP